MKIQSHSPIRPFLAAAMMASILPGFSGLALADSGHGHAHDHANHSHGSPGGGGVVPKSVGGAWAIVQESVKQIEAHLSAKTLAEVHASEERLASSLKWLLENRESVSEEKLPRQQAAVNQAARLSENLHVAADEGDQARSEAEFKKLRAALTLVAAQYPKEALVAPPEEEHHHHPAAASEPTLKVAVRSLTPLKVGEKADVIVRLTKPDDSPALLDDLIESHTEKIHLLIIDSSLIDYHHEHPIPTDIPGEYRFSFTPRKPGSYRVWADVIPAATKAQEYAIGDLEAPTQGEAITARKTLLKGEHDGLQYEVSFEKPIIRVGEAALGKVRITKKDGTIFEQLEPVMGAYAHIVGFGEDYESIAHVHPMGKEPTAPSERGKGDLDFHLLPAKAGLMRLFVQVQIGGEQVFIPYTLEIAPELAAAKTEVHSEGGGVASEAFKQSLVAYVEAQKALAGDSMTGVREAANKIVKASQDDKAKELEAHAQKVAAAKSIQEARTAFKPLSESLIATLTSTTGKLGYFVVNCPHAGASWIQADRAVRNPYYGKEMLTCGFIKAEK